MCDTRRNGTACLTLAEVFVSRSIVRNRRPQLVISKGVPNRCQMKRTVDIPSYQHGVMSSREERSRPVTQFLHSVYLRRAVSFRVLKECTSSGAAICDEKLRPRTISLLD